MADDDELEKHHATARPPPGEEDVYSASTVASEASDEMLAIIRGESQRGFPAAPGVPKNLKVDPKSDPKIATRSDATANWKSELPDMRATAPPPSVSGSKLAYTSTPLEVPVTSLTPTTDPPPSVEIAPDPEPEPEAPAALAGKTHDEADSERGTLHPAVGIVLFFVAVFAVLAALIR